MLGSIGYIISSVEAFARLGILEVRYRTIPELRRTFGAALGPASTEVEAFFAQSASQRFAAFFTAVQAACSSVTQLVAAFEAGTGLRIRSQVKATAKNAADRMNLPPRDISFAHS